MDILRFRLTLFSTGQEMGFELASNYSSFSHSRENEQSYETIYSHWLQKRGKMGLLDMFPSPSPHEEKRMPLLLRIGENILAKTLKIRWLYGYINFVESYLKLCVS